MTASGEEPLPLQVTSIDSSAPGIIRLRVVSPVSGEGGLNETALGASARSGTGLIGTVDGEPAPVSAEPVDVQSLSVTLAVDTSQSMAGPAIEAAKAAAVDFVEALPDEAEVSVVGFGDVAVLRSPGSSDKSVAVEAITSLEAGGETSLYDGIATALEAGGGAGRRALVVLSDGGDTASTATLDQAKVGLGAEEVEFVAIALATDESNSAVLSELADTASGSVVTTDDPAALNALYRDLATALSSEYEVTIEIGEVDVDSSVSLMLSVVDPSGGPGYQWRDRVVLAGANQRESTATEQPPPVIQRLEAPSAVLAGGAALWSGATLVVAAVLVAGYALVSAGTDGARSRPGRLVGPNDAHIRAFRDLRSGASLMVEGVLVDADTRADLAERMEQAGLRIRTGEFVIVSLLLMLIGGVVGTMVWSVSSALLCAAVGALAPRAFLRVLIGRRRKAFGRQLPDLLSALSNTLKVGYSLPQAINSVADDAAEPAGGELKRALLEARVGGDLVESLRGVARRTCSTDLDWVVDAVEINATVGGDLVDVLERVAETIRSRTRMKAQIGALTAEARMSALVLFLLPPGLGLVILVLNPQYFEGIWDGVGGFVLVGLAGLLLGAGGLWLRRMISSVSP